MKLLQFTKKHLPGILTGTGIVLDVSGAVAMGDACVKANRVIEAKTLELDRQKKKNSRQLGSSSYYRQDFSFLADHVMWARTSQATRSNWRL